MAYQNMQYSKIYSENSSLPQADSTNKRSVQTCRKSPCQLSFCAKKDPLPCLRADNNRRHSVNCFGGFGGGVVGFGGVVFVRHGSNSFSKIQKCVMISP